MKNIRCHLTAFCILFFLTACSESPKPAEVVPDIQQAPKASPVDASPLSGNNGIITATPGSLPCGSLGNVTINWLWEQQPAGKLVEIWVGETTDSDTKIFVQAGSSGSQETGAWVTPDTVFRVIDSESKQELDRLRIAGGTCVADTMNE